MSIIGRDYYVRYQDEPTIAAKAVQWRKAAEPYLRAYFNIVDFVRHVLCERLPEKLHIEFFDMRGRRKPAYVRYKPLTLHIDHEIWKLADLGDPKARLILAHEIGHIVLHDHRAQAFSNDPSVKVNFARNEESAEWQANTFAAHFLLPTDIVVALDCLDRLIGCGVPVELAKERLTTVRKSRLYQTQCGGDACPKCGNFTLAPNAPFTKCDTCGSSTEGS
jgi:IrrE N-terminal-like domain